MTTVAGEFNVQMRAAWLANSTEVIMETIDVHDDRFVVRGSESFRSAQGARYAPGVSAETVGAGSLFLGLITLPPGERTKAHAHRHESAHYMLSGGEVELWTGPRLQRCSVARPGDYLFIPAAMPHVAVNRGTEPAVFVGARSEASATESVAMLPELDGLVP